MVLGFSLFDRCSPRLVIRPRDVSHIRTDDRTLRSIDSIIDAKIIRVDTPIEYLSIQQQKRSRVNKHSIRTKHLFKHQSVKISLYPICYFYLVLRVVGNIDEYSLRIIRILWNTRSLTTVYASRCTVHARGYNATASIKRNDRWDIYIYIIYYRYNRNTERQLLNNAINPQLTISCSFAFYPFYC